jgi:hypothetical protein
MTSIFILFGSALLICVTLLCIGFSKKVSKFGRLIAIVSSRIVVIATLVISYFINKELQNQFIILVIFFSCFQIFSIITDIRSYKRDKILDKWERMYMIDKEQDS